MIKITYPQQAFKMKEADNKTFIFDEVRKLWVKLTPEEWVRQNFLQYLVQHMHYPAKWLAIEKEIRLGELRKRCDVVVYQNSQPWMIVECKEMGVPLSDKTIKQVLNYNQRLKVPYLIITNGHTTYGLDTLQQQPLEQLPLYVS
jgi:hypothetical protein